MGLRRPLKGSRLERARAVNTRSMCDNKSLFLYQGALRNKAPYYDLWFHEEPLTSSKSFHCEKGKFHVDYQNVLQTKKIMVILRTFH